MGTSIQTVPTVGLSVKTMKHAGVSMKVRACPRHDWLWGPLPLASAGISPRWPLVLARPCGCCLAFLRAGSFGAAVRMHRVVSCRETHARGSGSAQARGLRVIAFFSRRISISSQCALAISHALTRDRARTTGQYTSVQPTLPFLLLPFPLGKLPRSIDTGSCVLSARRGIWVARHNSGASGAVTHEAAMSFSSSWTRTTCARALTLPSPAPHRHRSNASRRATPASCLAGARSLRYCERRVHPTTRSSLPQATQTWQACRDCAVTSRWHPRVTQKIVFVRARSLVACCMLLNNTLR